MQTAAFAHPGRNIEALQIQQGISVADFGAGSGHYTLLFAQAVGEAGRVYAVDVQADLLRRLKNEAQKKGYENVETILGDIARAHGTKLRSRCVDMVLMSNVLFQLEHPLKAFEEARRILKLDGRLIVIDWSDSFRSLGPAKRHVYRREQALQDAKAARFAFADDFAAGAHHYGLIFVPV